MVDTRLSTTLPLNRCGLPTAYMQDSSGRGVAPVAIRDGSGGRPRRMLADSQVASEWTATDTAKIGLSVKRFTLPMLRRTGLYSWDIVGDYENTAPANTTISAQMLVGPVGAQVETGATFAWTQNGAVTSPGIILLTLDMRLLALRQLVTAELTIINTSGTAVIGPPTSVTRLHQIFALSTLVEQNIGWQVWKSTSAGVNPLSIQSVGFYERLTTFGS